MLSVLLLFLLPVGGGIPAGVLLARAQGLAWPTTAGLYLVSDLVLALAFEPVLRLLVALGRRVGFLARLGAALNLVLSRSAATFRGSAPASLVLVAFGVDPMTGRAAALAAGHGLVTGWALAITGDMLYYAAVAGVTLRLNAWFRNPELTVLAVLGAMVLAPPLLRGLWRGRSLRS